MTSPTLDTRLPRRARLVPAFGLFLLAPLIGEFLLGNVPITSLGALVLLAPLYGGGSLLIRETVRRFNRGWPSIIIMCAAYGIFEEAFITQSLFNPNYLGLRLLDYGFIPALGISAWWTVYVLTLHIVWSTAVPIALAEACAPRTRHTPWLGWLGLTITGLVFVLGSGILLISQLPAYVSSAPQFITSALLIVALIVVAFVLGRRKADSGTVGQAAPAPRIIGASMFVLGSAFMILAAIVQSALPAVLNVAGLILLLAIGGGMVWYWSRRSGWGEWHTLSVAGGLLLVYAWFGFYQVSSVPGTDQTLDLIGNAIFAGLAVALLFFARRRLNTEH